MKSTQTPIWLLSLLTILPLTLSSCFTSKKIPSFPDNTDALIENTVRKGVTPEWHLGKSDTVCTDELCIYFESIGDIEDPTILLIMGYGTSGLAWSTNFIEPLVDASFHVVRFDNRDVGKTQWQQGKEPQNGQFYYLSDMAKDACQILDKLGKEQVHIVGISMGGMIAQELAINYPKRVKTLTCLSSTAHYFDPDLVSISGKVIAENAKTILKYGLDPKSIEKQVKKRINQVSFLRNDEFIDEDMVIFTTQRLLFKQQNNYNNHPKMNQRHSKAIRKSGSRLEQLGKLEMPTLLIHGTKDVLIFHQHTEKYAKLIANKKEVYIEGMGHIPTVEEEKRICNELLDFIEEEK